MKKYNILIITLLSFLFLISCTNKIMDEIDTNPNQINQAPLKSILPQVEVGYATEIAGGGSAIFASYMAELTTYVLGVNSYDRIDDFNEVAWVNGYLLLSDLLALEKEAIKTGALRYAGVAKVLQAFTWSGLIDFYGDIPYSEALNSENRSPNFDKDEVVYYQILNLLDDAIVDLKETTGATPGNDDLYFKGNMPLWIKTAHALKARLYNKLSNVDPTGSAQKALTEIEQSFSMSSENFSFDQYQNISSNANPFSKSQAAQPQTAVGNGIFNCMLSFSLTGNVEDDPRVAIWFSTVKGKYIAAPSGTAQSDFGEPKMDGAVYSKPITLKYLNAPQPLLTYPELLFIKSEAYLRLSKKPEAYLAYQEAIKLALQKASGFNPSLALSTTAISAYLANTKVMPGEASLTKEIILRQKYIYFFQYQPIEAYNETRRNDIVPAMNPYGRAARMTYPVTEVTRNPNVPKDINFYSIFESSTNLFWAN